jgi:hypothetical protein
MSLIRVGVWKFPTAQARNTGDLNLASWVGIAHTFKDAADLSASFGGYFVYTTGPSHTPQIISYAEAMALLGEPFWMKRAFKLFFSKIWDVLFRSLYYRFVWLKKNARPMTHAEFRGWDGINDRLFCEEIDVFLYVAPGLFNFAIAEVHMSGVKNNASNYIWIRKVLYRGPFAKLAADTSPAGHLRNFYVRLKK